MERWIDGSQDRRIDRWIGGSVDFWIARLVYQEIKGLVD